MQIPAWLVPAAFALHGVGMVGAASYLPWSMRAAKADFVGASWLLGSGIAAVVVGVLVWAVAGAGFTAAAWGLWRDAQWWRLAAWVGSAGTLSSRSASGPARCLSASTPAARLRLRLRLRRSSTSCGSLL